MTEFIPLQNSQMQMSLLEKELEKLGCKQNQSYFPMLSLLNNESPDTNIRLPTQNIVLKMRNTEEDQEDDTYQKYIKTIMTCDILNNTTKTITTSNVFIKLIPILEPVQFAMGEFHNNDDNMSLNKDGINTINQFNNTAYTEVFANYLLSLLVEKNKCPNFPMFYGTYSSIIDWFQYDYSEDWEGIQEHDFFREQHKRGKIVYDFRKNQFRDTLELESIKDDIILELEKIDLDTYEEDASICEIEDGSTVEKKENPNDTSYWCKLNKYPIQVGFFENLDYTLEEYIDEEGELSIDKWKSILFQIVFALSFIQKKFSMIHNDLHTDNIMFCKTDIEYFYYVIDNQIYRVPTYGRIVKIIDFARATYTLGNTIIFPNVFEENGDAEGQYDIPRNNKWNDEDIKPNPSFDLARLSTTLVEFVDENIEMMNLLLEWTKLDDGNTILFEEDSFELYCLIAKECHNAIPREQFKRQLFKDFRIKVTKENIDEIKQQTIYQL